MSVLEYAGVTKNIHQQGIGAGAGVEFSARSIVMTRQRLAALRVDLLQASSPGRVSEDGSVCAGQKVAVPRITVGLKTNSRRSTIAQAVRQVVLRGVLLGAIAQLFTKRSRPVRSRPLDWRGLRIFIGHRHDSSLPCSQLLPERRE